MAMRTELFFIKRDADKNVLAVRMREDVVTEPTFTSPALDRAAVKYNL
jgi:hypothetical protein